ncbi:MAG: PDZ domain-containing protein [Saprospiraceae bacterium]|nr:PDZ domain-containing protein [Saprospiraceae bacterium]
MEEEKKKFEIWQPFILALVLASGMLLGTKLDDQIPDHGLVQKKQGDEEWEKIISTIGYIRSRYDDDLNADSISIGAIEYLMEHLDPHSYFLGGLDHANFKDRMGGSYDGIGIEYEVLDDTVFLVGIMPNTPAEESGLEIGDCILAIDSHQVSGQNLGRRQAYEIWKSTGDVLQLTYLTSGDRHPQKTSISKRPIKVGSVPISLKLQEDLGYIRIAHFADRTYQDFMDSLGVLVDQNVNDLIIDVRDNPGGSFQEVVKILNQLISEEDVLMVYMDGKHLKRTEYRSTGKPFFRLDELVILVNEHSASASEVLAGVLQDLGRATIVGRRTFGKALVQEMYALGTDASLNLTVGKYYLPSGRFIQKTYSDRIAYDHELQDRMERGELMEADSVHLDSNLMVPDAQDVLRPVGQGVVPDIFVPLDSFTSIDPSSELSKRVRKELLKFYPQHREQIESLLHLPHFIEHTEIDTLATEFMMEIDLDESACPHDCKAEVRQLFTNGILKILGNEEGALRTRVQSDALLNSAINHVADDSGTQEL